MATFREKLELLIDANVQGFVGAMDKAGAAADKNLGKETQGKLDQLAGKFTVMGAAAFGGASVAAIGLGKLATLAGEAQVAQAKLDNSIANSSQKFADNGKAVSDLASSLQKKVAADDEAIRSGSAILVQFGLTERQVLQLTPLIVDLSRKMGVDLDAAAKAVGRSATGSTTALRRMGIDVASLGEGSTDAEKTISALSKSVGGFAQAEGATFSGQLQILRNQLSELGEGVGQGAAGTLQSIVGGLNDVTSAANDVNPGLTAAVGSFATLATIGVGGLGALSFAAGQFISMRDNLGQLTARLRDAEGNLTRFGQAAAGIGGVVIGAAVIAGVVEIGNQFNKASQDAEKFNRAVLVLGGGAAGNQTQAFATAVNSLTGSLDDLGQKADELNKFSEGTGIQGPLNFLNLFSADSDLVGKVKVGSRSITVDLNQLGEAVDKIGDGGNIVAMKNALRELGNIQPSAPQGTEAYKTQNKEIAEQTGRLKSLYTSAVEASAAESSLAVAAQQDTKARREAGLATGEFAATAEDLKDRLTDLTIAQKALTAQYDVSQAAAKGFSSALGFVTNNAADVIDSAQALGKAVESAFKPTGDGGAAAIRALPPVFDAATAATGGYTEAQNKAIDGLQAYGAAAQKNLATLVSTGATNDQVLAAAQGYADFITAQLIPAFEAQGLATQDAESAAAAYVAQLGLTKPQVETQIVLKGAEQARQTLQFLQLDIDNLTGQERDAIVNLVRKGDWTGALNLYNSIKDKTVVVDLAIVSRGDITQTPLVKGFFPGWGGKRAAGGPVDMGKTYLVGEKGPEMFTAPAGGVITPNDQLRRMVTSSSSVTNTGPTVSVGAINITEASSGTTTGREVVRKMRDLAYLGG